MLNGKNCTMSFLIEINQNPLWNAIFQNCIFACKLHS